MSSNTADMDSIIVALTMVNAELEASVVSKIYYQPNLYMYFRIMDQI